VPQGGLATARGPAGREVSQSNCSVGSRKRKKKALKEKEQLVSSEAVRRLSAAALVANRIHSETLVLINLYAHNTEEYGRAIDHAWTMRSVLYFLYEVTGGPPAKRKRTVSVVVGNEPPLEVPEDNDENDQREAAPVHHDSQDLQTAVHDTIMRLYAPLHRDANVPPLSREGVPGDALQEIATHIAASINTDIQRHYWKRQVAHIKLRDGCTKKEAHSGTYSE